MMMMMMCEWASHSEAAILTAIRCKLTGIELQTHTHTHMHTHARTQHH